MSFCSSLVLVPKKSTPGFSQKHAKWFKAQVCTQLLAAMTDPANDKIFNAKLGKLLHLPHPQSSSTPEPSTSTVTGKKRKSRGGQPDGDVGMSAALGGEMLFLMNNYK